jgi:hypothetical protein
MIVEGRGTEAEQHVRLRSNVRPSCSARQVSSAPRVAVGSVEHHIIRPLDAVSFGGVSCSATTISVSANGHYTFSTHGEFPKMPGVHSARQNVMRYLSDLFDAK